MQTLRAVVLIAVVRFFVLSITTAQKSESGMCSWYGAEGEIPEGYATYCGAANSSMSFHRLANNTAQHNVPIVPCGTCLNVTNTQNGKSIVLMVNDKCPNGRPTHILDLTYGAFSRIADPDLGNIKCSYVVLPNCAAHSHMY